MAVLLSLQYSKTHWVDKSITENSNPPLIGNSQSQGIDTGSDADVKEGLNHNGIAIDKEMARAKERGSNDN